MSPFTPYKLNPTTLRITHNGQSQDYSIAAIDEIHYQGYAGGDDFIADADLPIPLWLFAGSGDNTLQSGDGGDLIFVGDGNNTITTGDGDDMIVAGDGDNIITTGVGEDYIGVGDGQNEVSTGNGADTIVVGDGDNEIDSGGGDDHIETGEGSNDVESGSGNDQVNGIVNLPRIGIDAAEDILEGQSLAVTVWLSAPTNHDVSGSLVVTAETGTTTSDRWEQFEEEFLVPAGQHYVIVSFATNDNELMDGSNLSSVSLVGVSGAELETATPSPVFLWDNDESIVLDWFIPVGEDSESQFYGEVRATTNGDSLDASGVDNHGRPFQAHLTVNRTTWEQTIDLTIQGLDPEDDHWTGSSENSPLYNGRPPMFSDSLNGSGGFTGLFAQKPPERRCGDGGNLTVLTRSEDRGGPGRGNLIGEYHQEWNKFKLAEAAPDCGVVVIQRIIIWDTFETVNNEGVRETKQFSVAYYEVLGTIPARQTQLRGVTDYWENDGIPQFNAPTPRVTVNTIEQSGFAMAFENTAALQAVIANWQPIEVSRDLNGRNITYDSGNFKASTSFDAASFQLFADEDTWHYLEAKWTNPPRRTILKVDGQIKH